MNKQKLALVIAITATLIAFTNTIYIYNLTPKDNPNLAVGLLVFSIILFIISGQVLFSIKSKESEKDE